MRRVGGVIALVLLGASCGGQSATTTSEAVIGSAPTSATSDTFAPVTTTSVNNSTDANQGAPAASWMEWHIELLQDLVDEMQHRGLPLLAVDVSSVEWTGTVNDAEFRGRIRDVVWSPTEQPAWDVGDQVAFVMKVGDTRESAYFDEMGYTAWFLLEDTGRAKDALIEDPAQPGWFIGGSERVFVYGEGSWFLAAPTATMMAAWHYEPRTRLPCVPGMERTPAEALLSLFEEPSRRLWNEIRKWEVAAAFDPVTGDPVPVDATNLFYSTFLGATATGEESIALIPVGTPDTFRISVNVPGRTWTISPGVPDEGITFSEAGTGRFLGPIGHRGDIESGMFLYILPPDPGRDVNVHAEGYDDDEDSLTSCDGPVPGAIGAVVPYESIAGSGRIILDPLSLTWEPWTTEFTGSVKRAKELNTAAHAAWQEVRPDRYRYIATSGPMVPYPSSVVEVDGDSVITVCARGELLDDLKGFRTIDQWHNFIDRRLGQFDEVGFTLDESGLLESAFFTPNRQVEDGDWGITFEEVIANPATPLSCSE